MSFFSDFKKFINRGNVVDMAVGVVVGGAFSKIVSSLVADLITPLIGLATKGVNLKEMFLCLNPDAIEGQVFSHSAYPTVALAQAAGYATLNYGNFLQNIIDFLVIALCIFTAIRIVTHGHAALVNKLKEDELAKAAEEEAARKKAEEEAARKKAEEEAAAAAKETELDILRDIRRLLKENK